MEVFLLVVLMVGWVLFRILRGDAVSPHTRDRKKMDFGIRLYRQKRYEESLGFFEKMVRDFPKSAVAWNYKGKNELALGRPFDALMSLATCQQIDVRYGESYLDRAKALIALSDWESAWIEADKACWHLRNQGEPLRLRGFLHQKLGRLDKAAEDWKEAIKLGDEDAQYMLQQYRLPHNR